MFGGTGDPETYSTGTQFVAQLIGVGVTAAWSAIVSVILALAVNLAFPMRVSEDDEREGLDLASHGERAWEMD